MKKIKDYTILAMLIPFTIAVLANLPGCYKPTKGQCTFEGAECPNTQHYLRDYQLEFYYDTLKIYDGDRLVGMRIGTSEAGIYHGHFIDTTIANDNQ